MISMAVREEAERMKRQLSDPKNRVRLIDISSLAAVLLSRWRRSGLLSPVFSRHPVPTVSQQSGGRDLLKISLFGKLLEKKKKEKREKGCIIFCGISRSRFAVKFIIALTRLTHRHNKA